MKMDAVKYLKAKNRMLKADEWSKLFTRGVACSNIEQCVAHVEQWAKEHPVKTYKDKFLEMFPNAPEGFVHRVSLIELGWVKHCPSDTICEDCWNREYRELS